MSRFLLASLIGASLLCAGCGQSTAPAAEDSAPVVTALVVQPAAPAGSLSLSGLVGFKREVPLAFDAPGVVNSITVDVGDTVRRGQLLATLRRASVGANAAEAALARQTAERQLARVQALYDRGFASQAAIDEARLAVERARDAAPLLSPADGVVLVRNVDPAQTVNAGQPVLMVGDPAFGMVVRASAASSEALRAAVGDRATVHIADVGDRTGAVSRIAPKSDASTGAYEIEVRLENMSGLRSGQVAGVTLQAAGQGAQDETMIVPALALLDARADQAIIYVLDANNVAHRRAVTTGGLEGDGVIVVSGLTPGERIVSTGAAYVRDNAPVRVAAPPPA